MNTLYNMLEFGSYTMTTVGYQWWWWSDSWYRGCWLSMEGPWRVCWYTPQCRHCVVSGELQVSVHLALCQCWCAGRVRFNVPLDTEQVIWETIFLQDGWPN